MFRMIAAVGAGGVIGKDGKIPWDLPEDRQMFKELTMGGTLIVGRKTFESIGGPLPGRDMIVVTSQGTEFLNKLKEKFAADAIGAAGTIGSAVGGQGSILAAKDFKQALRMAGDTEAFFCGGERIYEEGLKYAEVLYLTKVELNVDGDAFFPADYEERFTMIDRTRLSANCTLLTYVKK